MARIAAATLPVGCDVGMFHEREQPQRSDLLTGGEMLRLGEQAERPIISSWQSSKGLQKSIATGFLMRHANTTSMRSGTSADGVATALREKHSDNGMYARGTPVCFQPIGSFAK